MLWFGITTEMKMAINRLLCEFMEVNIKLNCIWNHKMQKPLNRLMAKGAQAYTSKKCILIEVLPVPNAYTKSGDAYIHFAKFFCCLLMHNKGIGLYEYMH